MVTMTDERWNCNRKSLPMPDEPEGASGFQRQMSLKEE
jgi:hypothetical protein